MVTWLQVLGAFIGVYFTSILVDSPKKFIPISAGIGSAGWLLYLFLLPQNGPIVSNYLAGLLVAFCAHIVARVGKTPVTVVLIPGFYPLVPGVGMYRTIVYLIQGDSLGFQKNLQLTLMIAAMIALSVFSADAVVNACLRVTREWKVRSLRRQLRKRAKRESQGDTSPKPHS